MVEAHIITTIRVRNDYKLPKADDAEGTVSVYVCPNMNLSANEFPSHRGGPATILTQVTLMISPTIDTSFQLHRS